VPIFWAFFISEGIKVLERNERFLFTLLNNFALAELLLRAFNWVEKKLKHLNI